MATQGDDGETLDTLKSKRSSQTAEPPRLSPMLVRLLAADDLRPPSTRHWLDPFDEVRIFRGRAAATTEDARVLSIALDDRYASTRHASLRRTADGFVVRDEGSTNGTFVDGHRLAEGEERLLGTALLEVGHTFFHLRQAVRGAPETQMSEQTGEPLTFSPEFALTLAAAGRLARRSHDLLLTGESGAGKEVLARWLHQISGRTGPLVAVNCAALPEQLLEDELFGHVKGAFSGAQSDRPGLLRSAHQGTLLLDEVGDMPAALQAKLLRVIEDRRVRPLGSEHEIQVDAQIIAATHRDLRAMAEDGRFREDLLARLGVLPLSVPPLRARREDLGLLIRGILRELPGGLQRIRFEPDALRMLLLHDWPLNVRELRRTLLAAADLVGADEQSPILVGPQHLPPAVHPRQVTPARPRLSSADEELRRRIVELLAQHRGNVAAVARALGKPRTHLQRLMARLGVERTDA